MSSRRKLVSGDGFVVVPNNSGDGSGSGRRIPPESDRSSDVFLAPDEELGFVPNPIIVSPTSCDGEESSFLIPICSVSSESGCFHQSHREEVEESSFLVPICSMSSLCGDNYKLGKIDSPAWSSSSAGDDYELGEIDSPGSAASASYDHSWYRPNFLKRMRSDDHEFAVMDCDIEEKIGIRVEELGKIDSSESAASASCDQIKIGDDDDQDMTGTRIIRRSDHHKFMESCDFSTWKHKALTLQANYLNKMKNSDHLDAMGNRNLYERLESLVKLNELMERWSELEEGQAQLELTMAQLIQENRYS